MTDHAARTEHSNVDARALVIYASTHGHTAKIATRLAQAMRSQGLEVDLREVSAAAGADPAAYDVAVVGGSIHKVHHQPEIVDWVKAHRAALEQGPTVFFSVSLSAAEDTDAARMAAQACVDEFCEDTGWTPGRTERIAGCLQYREYDVFTRQLMRLLMKRMGHPTDASHDYDYTDWDAVNRLGHEIADLAGARAPRGRGALPHVLDRDGGDDERADAGLAGGERCADRQPVRQAVRERGADDGQ